MTEIIVVLALVAAYMGCVLASKARNRTSGTEEWDRARRALDRRNPQ